MIIDIQAHEEKAMRAAERVTNYADGLEKAFSNRIDEATRETRNRTQREIVTAMAVERVEELRSFCVDEKLIDNVLAKESILKIDDTFTVPLRAFKARQTVEGVEIEFVRGTPAMVFDGAFGPKIAKLGRNIYKRLGRARFPIQKLRDLQATKIEGVKDAFDRGAAQAKSIMTRKLKEAKQDANDILGRDKYATT
jgi:hypothetical protein